MRSNHYIILLLSFCLYFILCIALHPFYGYLLDSDAVGYLSVAERVANNDWFRSINGLWSPLNSWLIVPFLQNGKDAFLAAKAINFLCGGILLLQILYLVRRYVRSTFYFTCIAIAFPIVLVYYTYLQIFADILQLVFVMAYLQIILSTNYFKDLKKIILGAIFMALAYYAKAYSFPFYVLQTSIICLFFSYELSIAKLVNKFFSKPYEIKSETTTNISIGKIMIGLLFFTMLISPWVWQLHIKYGGYSVTGNSGKLNMSWNLLAHKEFKDSIKIFIPPTYNNGVTFWEDPYFSQAPLHSPFESGKMMLKWMARIAHTTITAVVCIGEISAFALAILLIAIWIFFFKQPNREARILLLTSLALPVGYLSMHIETRYIWLLTFIIIILAGMLLDLITERKIKKIVSVLFVLSLIAYPLYHLEKLRNKGKDNFEMASALNKQNIHGSFVTNNPDAGKQWVIAYLSKNRNYTIENYDFSSAQWAAEIKRYGIEYYWQYLENEINNTLPENTDIAFELVLKMGNYKVYKLIY
jgi:hypothetical protein